MTDVPIAVEPGTILGGRYRLRERLLLDPAEAFAPSTSGAPAGTSATAGSASSGAGHVLATPGTGDSAFWLAVDDLLNRPVGIHVLPTDSPLASEVLSAARRCATLGDPRFLAILDIDQADGVAYVVTEWVGTTDLATLVEVRPLSPAHACRVAFEVAQALTSAHAAGLVHRRLVPESVLWTEQGRVKIAGLAVAAALSGMATRTEPAAVLDDVHGIGGVLYAALTGRWPTVSGLSAATRLMPVSVRSGALSPGLLRAAIPAPVDELTCRALGAGTRHGRPFREPRQVADALLTATTDDLAAGGLGLPDLLAEEDGALGPAVSQPRDGVRGLLTGAVVLLLAGFALLTWQLGSALKAHTDGVAVKARSGAPAVTARNDPLPGSELPVRRAIDFDPQGSGGENGPAVGRAIDHDPDTSWQTNIYYSARMGGLKSGVGLVLDLGAVRGVSTVTLHLTGRDSDVELRAAAPSQAGGSPPGDLADYRPVSDAKGVGTLVTLPGTPTLRSRYLLVWFTSLPPSGDSRYRAGIADVRVRA